MSYCHLMNDGQLIRPQALTNVYKELNTTTDTLSKEDQEVAHGWYLGQSEFKDDTLLETNIISLNTTQPPGVS